MNIPPRVKSAIKAFSPLDWYILSCALEHGEADPPWTTRELSRDQGCMPSTIAAHRTALVKLGLLERGNRGKPAVRLTLLGQYVMASRAPGVAAWMWQAIDAGRCPSRWPVKLR